MFLSKKRLGSRNDEVFYFVTNAILAVITLLVLYPLIYIVSASFSSPNAVSSGKVILFPVEFSLEGYEAVFKNNMIVSGYANSLFYTIAGTVINVGLTLIAAYPLSRKDLPGKNILMFIFSFTMIFNGGIIPNYILIRDLGMINTRWALLLPGAISVYNMIVTRTFFQSNIPIELYEATSLDGGSDFKYFTSVVLPLSKAVIAVISLFYALSHWNAFFNAFLYLNNKSLFPLQIVLRDILISTSIDPSLVLDPETMAARQGLADLLKYSLIVVASAPMICLYPFVQKFFIKGVMIGSIKG
ncbi:MAG: carbohydrate ABC transporter permease [Clostridiaceae bacterium]|nr:carbohydrate ABC transporter permease [Clostridiaceae bacterium]